MCDCIPPPPIFDLPLPPDPSFIWFQLFEKNDSKNQNEIQTISKFFQKESKSSETCAYLNDVSLEFVNFIDSIGDGYFWKQVFNGKNVTTLNYFYYVIAFLFFILFIGCLAAICILRVRSNKLRVKYLQKSTPSLNSSKLSAETVGTATMIASVSSGNRNTTTNVSTSLNNCSKAIINSKYSSNLPQAYHSATISRKSFAPISQYYLYQTNQNHCLQKTNTLCCDCVSPTYCYATADIVSNNHKSHHLQQIQQKFSTCIYNSQSATNIFGNSCVINKPLTYGFNVCDKTNSCLTQCQSCLNKSTTKNNSRCATLCLKENAAQLSLLTRPNTNYDNCKILNHNNQNQLQNELYCAKPYDYEEISQSYLINTYKKTKKNNSIHNSDATIFEDISENLKPQETKKFRYPPPATKPPPIPTKPDLSNKCKEIPNLLLPLHQETLLNEKNFNIDLVNSSTNNELYKQNNYSVQQINEQNYDLACDDAISLTVSPSTSNDNEEHLMLSNKNNAISPKQDCKNTINRNCLNGRESGYGTGKSRNLCNQQNSPHFSHQNEKIASTETQQNFNLFNVSINNCTNYCCDNLMMQNNTSTMTYV